VTHKSVFHTTLCFFGAAPDTGNLGVSALCYSVLEGVANRLPDAAQTVFDHGVGGGRRGELRRSDAQPLCFDTLGAANTRRLWRPEALRRMDALSRLGLTGDRCLRVINRADAVLDISGGDSFSDIYGLSRFYTVATPKRIALRLKKPLILLPQTYGPFAASSVKHAAKKIVRASAMAWARDERSFASLKELLAGAFDPARHKLGVDVAFLLELLCPESADLAPIEDWLDAPAAGPIVGLNVSGLVYMAPDLARIRFGLRCDYRAALVGLCRRWLDETDARLLLVPHVMAPPGHYESDPEACALLAAELGADDRVRMAPAINDPRCMKWIISKCDWFCGTRMHSTIAALSTAVPSATLAYSGKAQGVFESCDQGAHVADMRTLDADAAAAVVWRSWANRAQTKPLLERGRDRVVSIAKEQMDSIADVISPTWCQRSAENSTSQPDPQPTTEQAA